MRAAVAVILAVSVLATGMAGAGDAASSVPADAYAKALEDARRELATVNSASGGDGRGVSVFLSIAALALAAAAAGWLVWQVRRKGLTGTGAREMRVVERLPLGRHSVLVMVEIGGRRVVLAEHAHGVAVLEGWVSDPGMRPEPPHSKEALAEANPGRSASDCGRGARGG